MLHEKDAGDLHALVSPAIFVPRVTEDDKIVSPIAGSTQQQNTKR